MTSAYPGALDDTTTHPAAAGVGAELDDYPHSALHGNSNDAIRAIEGELGVNPSGLFSTVLARLNASAFQHVLSSSGPGTSHATLGRSPLWTASLQVGGTWHPTSAHGPTPPTSGIYLLSTLFVGGALTQLHIVRNGSAEVLVNTPTASGSRLRATEVMYVNAGEELSTFVYATGVFPFTATYDIFKLT